MWEINLSCLIVSFTAASRGAISVRPTPQQSSDYIELKNKLTFSKGIKLNSLKQI